MSLERLFLFQVANGSRHGDSIKIPTLMPPWLLNFTLPQFSAKTEKSIQRGEVTKGVRSEVIAALAWEVWRHTQYPTFEEYNEICQSLVRKHPILRDTIGNGYVSLFVHSYIAPTFVLT